MEQQHKERTSRASSTSSLGREVRCGCQYFQSDSLLPERSALTRRPPSRTMRSPEIRCREHEHEYEPIAPPSSQMTPTMMMMMTPPPMAPVVRITDTDVMPVADSDESIDNDPGGPMQVRLILDGDIILPLDGKIEDNAMEGRELGDNDTSEEQDSLPQIQARLDERYLHAETPASNESRTVNEINTNQVDSSAQEEPRLDTGARGLPQRLRNQAGKLKTRLKGIQRPKFHLPERTKKKKPEKVTSISSTRSTGGSSNTNKSSDKSQRSEQAPSRIDRLRISLSEKPKFSLPDRSKFHLPDAAKFRLPERPKFNIKRPIAIKLPKALVRSKKSPSPKALPSQEQTEETAKARHKIFDFSTVPRMFDRKTKAKEEYVTSSPKQSRVRSTDSEKEAPRRHKGIPLSAKWAQRFDQTANIDDDRPDGLTIVERIHPWRHPSLEEPRLSIRDEEEIRQFAQRIPWEKRRQQSDQEEIEEEELERAETQYIRESIAKRQGQVPSIPFKEESYEPESIEHELPPKQDIRPEIVDEIIIANEQEMIPMQRSQSLDERYVMQSFPPVDPRRFDSRELVSDEEIEDELDEEIPEGGSSMHSDKEQQQSSGSSCDRRRRGVIEEIDADEFFLREGGISQGDIELGQYLTDEIREALRSSKRSPSPPPQRPVRSKAFRKRKDDSVESYSQENILPSIPKRERSHLHGSEESFNEAFLEQSTDSGHRIVYQTEPSPRQLSIEKEPLDDIVIVKPLRKKSKASLRSQSQILTSTVRESLSSLTTPGNLATLPPMVPNRRKKIRRDMRTQSRDENTLPPVCNGHHQEWQETSDAPDKPLPSPPPSPVETPTPMLLSRPKPNESILMSSHENLRNVSALRERIGRQDDYIESAPIPPKRRSRSRATSVAQDDDRTSRGAESLPEIGYLDDTSSARDLSDYAIIDKRDKLPPPPPPPRRKKRDKFATTPRSFAPKRPIRAYSTLGPAKSKDSRIFSSTQTLPDAETMRTRTMSYEESNKDLRSGEILSKVQRRPLPAPPRPPRVRKGLSLEGLASRPSLPREMSETSGEMTAATQTDPLPDDMVIEEDMVSAKLIVAPSRTGSQILVSTERIATPTGRVTTPPVPPLPLSRENELWSTTVPEEKRIAPRQESPLFGSSYEDRKPSIRRQGSSFESARSEDRPPDVTETKERYVREKRGEETTTSQPRTAIVLPSSEEPLRIDSLEVGSLKVDRLSVSQMDAHKIITSEIDAMIVSASELKGVSGTVQEEVSPSLLKELLALRSHLEMVAAQSRERYSESTKTESKIDESSKTKIHSDKKEEEKVARVQHSPERSLSPGPPPVTKKIESSRASLPPADRPPSPTEKPASPDISSTPKTIDPAIKTESSTDEGAKELQTIQPSEKETSETSETKVCRQSRSRSRSSSPGKSIHAVRQTASPVRSLPPVISVTPDTPDATITHSISSDSHQQPQRAVISYSEDHSVDYTSERREILPRESSQSPVSNFPTGTTHFIAFPASQIPQEFFTLASTTPATSHTESDPSLMDSTQQLLRALRIAGARAMKYFVGQLVSRVGGEDSREKINEIELAICALLLLIAGLLIYCFGNPRTITYYHHWDYFNPPQ